MSRSQPLDGKGAHIYVDCSYTFTTNAGRGVPRVVRSIVRHGVGRSNVSPVIFQGDEFYEIPVEEFLATPVSESGPGPLETYLLRVYLAILGLISSAGLPRFSRWLAKFTAKNSTLSVAWVGAKNKLLNLLRGRPGRRFSPKRASPRHDLRPIAFRAEDVLFLPDATWVVRPYRTLDRLQQAGVRIVILCHDLLPVTARHLCPDPTSEFESWMRVWLPRADGVVTATETTRGEVCAYLELQGQAFKPNAWSAVCSFGCDLFDPTSASDQRADDRSLLAEHPQLKANLREDYYLCVGAIEPRKNHLMLLNAFELLWDAGCDVQTVWAGRWTLEAETIRQHVVVHPELGKRLITVQGLPDGALSQLYRNARALVFPSLGEGFGLPLIEAMSAGCPIIASDIPVHRDVCGVDALYFDPNNAMSLSRLIRRVESGLQSLPVPEKARVPPWSEAVDELFETIERQCDV